MKFQPYMAYIEWDDPTPLKKVHRHVSSHASQDPNYQLQDTILQL